MKKNQRKKTTVTTSTAFFLCFYSFSSVYGLSLQELLLQSPSTCVNLLEEKKILNSNSLPVYLEVIHSSLDKKSIDNDFIYTNLKLFENHQYPATSFSQPDSTVALQEKELPIILQPKQPLLSITSYSSFLKPLPGSTLLQNDKKQTYFIPSEQTIINPNLPLTQSPPLSITASLMSSRHSIDYNFQSTPDYLLVVSNLPPHDKLAKTPSPSSLLSPSLSKSTSCTLEKKTQVTDPLLAPCETSNETFFLEKKPTFLCSLPIENSLFSAKFVNPPLEDLITHHQFLDCKKIGFTKALPVKNSFFLRPSIFVKTQIDSDLKTHFISNPTLETPSITLAGISETNNFQPNVFLGSKNHSLHLQSHLASFFLYYIAFEDDNCPIYSLPKHGSSLSPKSISVTYQTALQPDAFSIKTFSPSKEPFSEKFIVAYPELKLPDALYNSIATCYFEQKPLSEEFSKTYYGKASVETKKISILPHKTSSQTTSIDLTENASKGCFYNKIKEDTCLVSSFKEQPEAVGLIFEKPTIALLTIKLYESSSKPYLTTSLQQLDTLYVFNLLKDDSIFSSQGSARFMKELYPTDSAAIICIKQVPLKTSISLKENPSAQAISLPDPSAEQFFVMQKTAPTFLKDFYKEVISNPSPMTFVAVASDAPTLIVDPLHYHSKDYLLNRPESLKSASDSLECLSLSLAPLSYITQIPLEFKQPTLSEEPSFPITIDYGHTYNSFKKPALNLTATTTLTFLEDATTAWLTYAHNPSIAFVKQPSSSYSTNLDATSLSKNTNPLSTHIKQETPLIFAKAHSELQISLANLPGLQPKIHQMTSLPNPFLYGSINTQVAFKQTDKTPSLVTRNKDLTPTRKSAYTINKASRNIKNTQVEMPTLEELHTASLSDDFDVQIEVIPMPKEKGYLFAVTLTPPQEEPLPHAAQNIIFLMDRSASIEKNRFQVFKQAITKSLMYLHEGDTFNILSFDMELSKMSHESVFITPSSKLAANRFLESQRRGYKYVLPNLYEILLTAHSMAKTSELPTTVILLTNGSNLDKFNVHNDHLSHLVSNNKGNFSLFTACASQNNNTLMLEILSNLNKGELMHSQTHAAFPRKLATLVKHAGNLIAQDIHVNAIQLYADSKIELLADSTTAPNLYSDRSYTILGKIDELRDFDLVLQGRFCQNWLNITKKISFKTAKTGNYAIYKNYSMQLAYQQYKEFLKEGNTAYLDSATKVFHPFTPLN